MTEIFCQSTLSAFFNTAQNVHCPQLCISVWIIYVLNMFSVLWRQLRWKWKKSVFLFSSRIQCSQKFDILGLRSWKGAKIPVSLMKSRKDRKFPVLGQLVGQAERLKCCKLCDKHCARGSTVLNPAAFSTLYIYFLNLPAENQSRCPSVISSCSSNHQRSNP